MAVNKTQIGREAARMLVEKLKSAGRLPALRKELPLQIDERASVQTLKNYPLHFLKPANPRRVRFYSDLNFGLSSVDL